MEFSPPKPALMLQEELREREEEGLELRAHDLGVEEMESR